MVFIDIIQLHRSNKMDNTNKILVIATLIIAAYITTKPNPPTADTYVNTVVARSASSDAGCDASP
jgi:hypothetical protein